MQIRQGDVLLEGVDKIPKGLKKRQDKTVALGEKTGHHHTFQGLVSVFGERNKEQYAEVEQEAILTHQEHNHIKIPQGNYKVVLQREHDLIEGIRQVTD